jgi:UDP-N-acetylglucosamine 2-epimerase
MKLLSIVGARPQFIKIAPLVRAIDLHNAGNASPRLDHRILHTGQHYDPGMSDVFFSELDLPTADFQLGVGSGTHGRQTAAMLTGIENVLEKERPDITIVYGDTNSTLAGALAAAKLQLPIAHVEAGLRSFDRKMPEEINRITADHLADILLAPTTTAMQHLAREGLAQRAIVTGDLMHDSVLYYRALATTTSSALARLGVKPGGYGLVTLHRAQNTDDPERLAALLGAFNQIAANGLPLVFPLHPRTAGRISAALPRWSPDSRLRLIGPVGYLDSLALLSDARVALTDSGGLQKEALFLGCPCVTLRSETEWVETLQAGANVLTDADPARILSAVETWGARHPRGHANFSAQAASAFGAGDAAENILRKLASFRPARRSLLKSDGGDGDNNVRLPGSREGVH